MEKKYANDAQFDGPAGLRKSIWKARIHERLKLLLWPIAHYLLPTGERMHDVFGSLIGISSLCSGGFDSSHDDSGNTMGRNVPSPSPIWLNPIPGRFRINFDAAFKEGRITLAVVVYDRSLRLHSLTTRCGNVESPLEAELRALEFALQFSSERNWDCVDFFSDSQEVVKAANVLVSLCGLFVLV
ncbi:Ribonuclease H-like domain containing protein [Trema orientale]|uniref:Ribonuclease H-like domain containing protein n=1 Tax=Trema orientale TaxID=63057 RepID=A0A2P5E8C5_TREOI|nr:Ribonuclease H-like domain containing protein [Trema orientale]